MEPMKYKDYVWPTNPRRLQVSYRRNISQLGLVSGGSVVQELGALCRVAEGEGEFSGESCLEQWAQLLQVFQEGGAGVLALPGHSPFYAHFRSLERLQEAFPGLIRYSFSFWEDGARPPSLGNLPSASEHTAAPGETLGSIAGLYQTSVDHLMACNRDISRPDRLSPGKRVRLV